jgi:hypothetical protein
MLESEWWSCEDLPPLLDDPAADVRGPALANFRKCHTEEPKSEAVRAERIALYRALLEHSSLEVKLRAGWVLSRLGDTSGTEVALQFLKGDPYGKETTLLAYAMETARRNTRERSAAMLYTIAMCDRARNPRGHYPGARHAAEQELNQLFGYDKWPPPYRRDTAVEEAMLPEFCVPID